MDATFSHIKVTIKCNTMQFFNVDFHLSKDRSPRFSRILQGTRGYLPGEGQGPVFSSECAGFEQSKPTGLTLYPYLSTSFKVFLKQNIYLPNSQ